MRALLGADPVFVCPGAKACAALSTAGAEYAAPDGEVVSGREAIEKSCADFFKANPKVLLHDGKDRTEQQMLIRLGEPTEMK